MIPITPPAGTNTGHGMYAILSGQYERSLPQRFLPVALVKTTDTLQAFQQENQERPLTATIWEILHG